ncbi:unnamed protein product [Paramecium octaurelia]|uniref:PSI domain-containing protein n=1 Tax=Paramecium octaurelia TaxID=43137 RepID=A0A8S1Y2A2_PAROT|nr:unnamed protein product [Paramecium octaurelia]
MKRLGQALILIYWLTLLQNTSAASNSLSVSNAACSCTQLLTEKECRERKCYWNNKKCSVLTINTTNYCDSIGIDVCKSTPGCANVSEKCVSFSGCSAYQYTTNETCQNISINCTTDGEQCIELDKCSSYTNQVSCVKDENGKFCYWSTEKSVCQLPTTCDLLPITLNSDLLCRAQISSCTMKEGGGCEASGEKCENQKLEGACVTSLDQKKNCIWDANQCKEKTCVNAPITNITHELCTTYLPTCTVNDTLNGCQDRPVTCSTAKIQNNCVINSAGQNCYWNKNNSKCEDKNCDNATDDYTTHDMCQSWLSTCTLKTGGVGCQTKLTDCTKYTTSNQCTKTLAGDDCFWYDTKCLLKSCANAPSTNVNHEMCSSFLPSCTVQIDLTGCETKKATCSLYTKEDQCISQLDGKLCIFQNEACIERVCANASEDLTNEQECKRFSPTCMVKSSYKGCILQECKNIDTKDRCSLDYQNKQCYYGLQCQLRSCANAPTTYKTDAECRSFLNECTVNEELKGCIERPSSCDKLNEQQCTRLTDNVTKCSWNDDDENNKACRILNCSDITPGAQTNDTCSTFDPSCTVADNPSICMAKPLGCSLIVNREHCFGVILSDMKSTCSWDKDQELCRDRQCSDADSTLKTETECRNYLATCTLSSTGNGCADEPTTCKGYKTKEVCQSLVSNPSNIVLCGWNGCESRTCSNAPILASGQIYTHVSCSSYLNTCTLNADQTGCVAKFTSCTDVNSQVQCGETVLVNGARCYYDVSTDNYFCRDFKCTDETSSLMTHVKCQNLSNQCTLAESGNGCVDLLSACSDIKETQQCEGIVLSGNRLCSWDTNPTPDSDTQIPVCKDRACKFSPLKDTADNCEKYLSTCTLGDPDLGCIDKPASCNGLNQKQCSNVKLVNGTYCSFDSTIADETQQCHARICADAPTKYQTDADCRTWLPNCTVKSDESGCVDEPSDCSLMMKLQCYKQSVKSVTCFWNANANPASCRVALCTDASTSLYTSDALCKAYRSDCTVAKANGCITQPTSCASLDQDHCPKVTINAASKDASENKCSWSASSSACQDRVCTDAPTTIITEEGCRSWLKTCTLGLTNQGCITEQTTCDLVQTQNQCQVLSNGTKCGWNTGCVNRTCSNAPDTYITDDQCRAYLSTCTVQADGTGCVIRASKCTDILVDKQCIKINDSKLCQWNSVKLKCEDRACTNAPTTLINHTMCQDFLPTCTVKASGTGCQTLLDKCSAYTVIKHCVQTTSGSGCQWILISGTGQCVDVYETCSSYTMESSCTAQRDKSKCIWLNGSCYNRECQHAPKSYSTHEQCQEYGNCTTNGQGCINYIPCDQYKYAASCVKGLNGSCILVNQCQNIGCDLAPTTYKTHSDCQAFLSTCTTNGNGCIEIKRCQDAYVEEACKINASQKECAWVNGICYDKSCDTADATIQSEKGCIEYYSQGNCTTKKGGGCVTKGKCKDAQVEAACISQYDGQKCSWQNGTCQLRSCTDLLGYDHQTCNTAQADCTTDGFQCTMMKTCSNTSIQQACLKGTDGPCRWSEDKCLKYTKCSDLIYSTHVQCNSIHPQCTTNGMNCVAITKCSKTPKIACFVGTTNNSIGKCIWTPTTVKASAPYQCIDFTDCANALYLNHNDCYNYSLGECTSDGVNGCIKLDNCAKYTVESACFIDKAGKSLNSAGAVTATGKCKWSTDKCVAQGCADIVGSSHSDCNGQLSTCTYNGKNCAVQGTCSSYTTNDSCTVATGTDGKCIWDSNACSAMKCEDYPVTLCSLYSSTCIQDGSTCVSLKDCTSYKTQTACDYGSPTSVCAWIVTTTNNKGKCVEVTTCTIATVYEKACKKLSDRCYWQSITVANSTEHICAPKTCEIQTSTTCTGFYDWSLKTYTVCQFSAQGKCVSTDPTSLNQNDCPLATLYQYTWNPTTNKCTICNVVQTNNSTQSNQSNTTEDSSAVILSIVILLGFVI